jgi:hypothetical protein
MAPISSYRAMSIGWFVDAAVDVSRPIRLKSSEQTFFGTRLRAPEYVCHEGRLLAYLTC